MHRLLLIFLLFFSQLAFSQMSVDYPYNNQVFQRSFTNSAEVSFMGKVPQEATRVEYQLLSIQNGLEIASDWKLLDSVSIGGFYQGKLDVKGGLYKFKVRSKNNTIVLDSAVLNRFGVGEVYIIAGQSNAQGVDRTAYNAGTNNEMVFSANFSNYFEPTATEKFTFIGTNNLDFPKNTFEVLKNTSIIGPTGLSNFFWPSLGEKIATSTSVPVCFFNVAWSGTSIRNWAESSRGIASKNPWIDAYYAKGFPFENLKQVIKSYAGQNGVRAILWQIGETDTDKLMPTSDFVNYFKEVQIAVESFSGLSIPMVVAQGTYIGKLVNGTCVPTNDYTGIVNGIKNLWDLPNGNFLIGPNTDLIEIPRLGTQAENCVHFSPNSFKLLADSWYTKLVSIYSTNNRIIQAINFPFFDKYCGDNNSNDIKLSNKAFDLYQNSLKIEPDSNSVYKNLYGTSLKLVYNKNRKIDFSSPLFPILEYSTTTPPTITAKGLTSICEGSQLEIESDITQSVWNTGIQSKSISVTKAGDYYATTRNQFNCLSNPSNSITLKVFENPKAPLITQSSPYFLYGGIKVFNTDYHWQMGTIDLNKSDVYLKVSQSGTYKIFASKTYSPDLTCKSTASEFVYSLPNDAGLTAFPNPVGTFGQLTIESISNLSNAKFSLIDEMGKMVKEGNVSTNDSFKLDVNGIATGKYVLLISTADQKNYTKRIIIGK